MAGDAAAPQARKARATRRLVIALIANCALATPAAAAAVEERVGTYEGGGVRTTLDRSAVAATGAAIVAVDHASVVVTASASDLRRLSYRVAPFARPRLSHPRRPSRPGTTPPDARVLWPYGCTIADTAPGLDADHHPALVAIGQSMAAANGYTPQQASDLYITDGAIDDWLWGVEGVFGFTFEMYRRPTAPASTRPTRSSPPRRPATARRSCGCWRSPTALRR